MTFDLSYDHWKRILDEDEQDFVQAMLVMKTPQAAADMCGMTVSKARKLSKSPRIAMALDLARKDLRASTHFTPADVAEDLMLIRDMALGRIPIAKVVTPKDSSPYTTYVRETNLGAASKAVENLGRMLGVFTDKKEISIPASDAQILKKIEDILGVTIDGSAEEVTNAVDATFEKIEQSHLKSMSLDAVAEDILSDPILKDVLTEKLTPSQAQRGGQ